MLAIWVVVGCSGIEVGTVSVGWRMSCLGVGSLYFIWVSWWNPLYSPTSHKVHNYANTTAVAILGPKQIK